MSSPHQGQKDRACTSFVRFRWDLPDVVQPHVLQRVGLRSETGRILQPLPESPPVAVPFRSASRTYQPAAWVRANSIHRTQPSWCEHFVWCSSTDDQAFISCAEKFSGALLPIARPAMHCDCHIRSWQHQLGDVSYGSCHICFRTCHLWHSLSWGRLSEAFAFGSCRLCALVWKKPKRRRAARTGQIGLILHPHLLRVGPAPIKTGQLSPC